MFQGHEVEILLFVISTIFAIVSYFLKQKDVAQEKQITVLWTKHDKLAEDHKDLEFKVAKEYYVRSELDDRFNKIEKIFKEAMMDLKTEMIGMRTDFKQMSEVLVSHVLREDAREEARLKLEQSKLHKQHIQD